MKPNYKLTNIRPTDQLRDLNDQNHISNFIQYQLFTEKGTHYLNLVTKTILRQSKSIIFLFDIQGQTFWCKEAEFVPIEYALKNNNGQIIMYYINGSTSNSIDQPASSLDGYELCIKFN